jgi:rSAM-associated Gly-rich repeat protein
LSLHRKYLRILSALAPSGAVGMSILLASSAPSVAREHPAGAEPSATPSPRVSERLDAIRGAVSEAMGTGIVATESPTGERQLAWGNWGNGGWGHGGGWGNGGVGIFLGSPWNDWNNWHNWGNGWGNGGWHNW